MATHSWPLIGPEASCDDVLEITPTSMGSADGNWQVTKRRLRGGLSEGVDLIEVDNGHLCFAVIPTRGMGIWKAWLGGRTLGWQSPIRGPVHPMYVPVSEPSGWGWLDGFDELMCRCGLQSNGAPDFDEQGKLLCPLHGHIANRPAHQVELIVDETRDTLTLLGFVDEARFHHQKLRLVTSMSTAFGSQSITWDDTVKNFGGWSTTLQMLYHTNIGQPELGPGTRFLAPVRQVAPMGPETPQPTATNWQEYGPPDADFQQQVFLFDLISDADQNTQVLLVNDAENSAVRLRYGLQSLPCFSLWKNLVAEADGYVTGLEPATNFPYPHRSEAAAGRVVTLGAGESWTSHITLDWLTKAEQASQAVGEIDKLQSGITPTLLDDISAMRLPGNSC